MSKAEDIKTEVGMRGLEFFRANATINKHGVATITQKQYFDFHKAEGVDREVIERFTSAENELLNGGYLFANELMRKAATEGGCKGDAEKTIAKVRITKPSETINVAAVSKAVCRIPLKPDAIAAGKDATKTKYGVTSIRIDRERSIDATVVEQCEAAAAALYK